MRNSLLIVLLMLSTSLQAQQRGKVAIVHPQNYGSILDSIVQSLSIKPVEIDTTLPGNLNEYDAIFASIATDSATELLLLNYISSGGKLYTDGGPLLVGDSVDSLKDPLWFRIGERAFLFTDLNIFVSAVDGTVPFTNDIYDSFPPYRYEIGYGGMVGYINPILVAWGNDGMSTTLAFISRDTALKVVVEEGALNYQIPGNYYQKLIADIACNYFNLCSESVPYVPEKSTNNSFTIIRVSREKGFSISSNFVVGSRVSLMNSLGIVLSKSTVPYGATIQELPSNLRRGFYFVCVGDGNMVQGKPFVVSD